MTAFDFSDYREFIRHKLSGDLYSPAGRKRSTLKRVAESIGYSSPSLLSMVVNGRRSPSEELCEALSHAWQLPLREREYFRLLVKLGRARQERRDPGSILQDMKRVAGHRAIHVYDEAQFAILREWHMIVVKQLIGCAGFREDPAWISRVLRKKITPAQARAALEKLEECGIVRRDSQSGTLRLRVDGAETPSRMPSAAIRGHHAQMLQRAAEALEDRPPEDRHFHSLTFRVSPERTADLRDRIEEFMKALNDEFSEASADSVFQVGVQMFEHTAKGDEV